MTCPACGHENRPVAKFCEDCAAPISRLCASCGSELRPTAKFCDECGAEIQGLGVRGLVGVSGKGETLTPNPLTPSPRSYTPKHLADKILQSKCALEGERKQVTVLFADVKGSMELEEQLDPEEWSQIMNRFFTLLADGVERFEGFVDKFTGDGIMALFGAPIAHEDHAQRACWAALHLQESVRAYADELRRTRGLNFSVRMGLNSGEVVVGKIGDDLRMDYTAQGHTVGLAQRTEQLAEAGRTYLTEHTAALVGDYFRLRDLGAFTLKGVRHPVHIHELEGAGRLAHPARHRAGAGILALRRPRRRDGGGRGRHGAGVRRPGTGDRRRGRARGRKEPPLSQAHRTGSGPGRARPHRPLRRARQDDPLPAGPRADARLLRSSPSRTATRRHGGRSPAPCCCSTRR